MRQTICDAIAAKRLVVFQYDGCERVVEPRLCGQNTAGHDALLAWFVRGYSESKAGPGWRMYLLSEIQSIRQLDETFERARTGYNPTDGSMRIVYCQVPRNTA